VQVKVDIQLRCNSCDTVLTTSVVTLADKDGLYAYVDPCQKCAAQQQHAPDVLRSGHCEHVPDGQYCPYCKEA
jgi:hypothetical protein